ncbi:MAG: MATE family efflux transporter, partial [Rhodospirillaceae bacterium]|nr:MATE family efflux transporter [Rhodospirillaceae bacterium]
SALVAFAMMAGFTIYASRDVEISKYIPYNNFLHINREGISEIFRIGVPSGLTTLGNVGIYLISTPIISLFGPEALAAHAIALRLAGVAYAIPVGLSQAATVRTGYNIGKNDNEAVGNVKRTAITMATVSGIACFSILAATSEILPTLFLPNGGEATAIAATLIIFLGAINFAEYPNVVAGGILRGAKDTRTPMILTLTGYWAFGAPIMAMMAGTAGYGAEGVWFGLLVGVYSTATLILGRLFAPDFTNKNFAKNAVGVAAK